MEIRSRYLAARSYSWEVAVFVHALAQGADQVGLPAFQKQFHVANRFLVSLGRGEVLHAGAEAAPDVVLQTRARMEAGEIHFARRDQEVAVDQVDDAVGEIGREVRAVVSAAVLAQAAGDVDAGVALAERQFHIGVSFVVAQQDVEAGLALFDEIVFERESFLVVGDDDVVNVDGFFYQRPGFGVGPAAFVEIGRHPAAQVLGLPDVDHLALGVLVEVHAGFGGDGADFLEEIHGRLLFY